jgi:hypothetical protein
MPAPALDTATYPPNSVQKVLMPPVRFVRFVNWNQFECGLEMLVNRSQFECGLEMLVRLYVD